MARKAHWQFLGLVLAVLGFILTAGTSGVNDWRLWYVDDTSVINSGVAWVGIWRACFLSHVFDTYEFCRSIRISDSFIPPEIAAGQVLCMTAIPIGIAGNLIAGYAVKDVYFNVNRRHIRWAFLLAGALYLLTAACTLIPVFWNVNSVLSNRTIDFPPEFHLPPAPNRQELGTGIIIGFGSSFLLIVSGLLFLSYRQPDRLQISDPEACSTEEEARGIPNLSTVTETVLEGIDNPMFMNGEKP
ncbi:hypothetical protein NFI96_005797 [Prochilodus magdalenae]|nr:hypothetical protein NFI96_005797 [Prochilodus magdalenae]